MEHIPVSSYFILCYQWLARIVSLDADKSPRTELIDRLTKFHMSGLSLDDIGKHCS
jgi:hypothetical protein